MASSPRTVPNAQALCLPCPHSQEASHVSGQPRGHLPGGPSLPTLPHLVSAASFMRPLGAPARPFTESPSLRGWRLEGLPGHVRACRWGPRMHVTGEVLGRLQRLELVRPCHVWAGDCPLQPGARRAAPLLATLSHSLGSL